MSEVQSFYGAQVKAELAAEGRYQRQLAEKEREAAQQELVCDKVTEFITDMCLGFGWENNYANRAKIAEMIKKTF